MESNLASLRPGRRGEGGVVLVEILVVAIIVAILAAVAIPVYTGSIRKQREETVKSLAQSAAVSANAFWRRHGRAPTASELGIYLPDSTRFDVWVDPVGDPDAQRIIAKDSLGDDDIVRHTVNFR